MLHLTPRRQHHDQRKAELAATYLSGPTMQAVGAAPGGGTLIRASRASPFTSAANSRSASPLHSRTSLSGITAAGAPGNLVGNVAAVAPAGAPLPKRLSASQQPALLLSAEQSVDASAGGSKGPTPATSQLLASAMPPKPPPRPPSTAGAASAAAAAAGNGRYAELEQSVEL